MPNVARPIIIADMIIAGLRPNLSPMWPKMAPPTGRGGVTDGKDPEGGEQRGDLIFGGEEELAQNWGEEAVDREVVPFEQAADRAGEAGPPLRSPRAA